MFCSSSLQQLTIWRGPPCLLAYLLQIFVPGTFPLNICTTTTEAKLFPSWVLWKPGQLNEGRRRSSRRRKKFFFSVQHFFSSFFCAQKLIGRVFRKRQLIKSDRIPSICFLLLIWLPTLPLPFMTRGLGYQRLLLQQQYNLEWCRSHTKVQPACPLKVKRISR